MLALVTGGCGFIGSHLVDRLVREGLEVRVLDSLQKRVHPRGMPPWVNLKARYIVGSVTDTEVLRKALDGVGIIFHQAAYQDYMTDFSRFTDVNVNGIALIYEHIVREKLPVKRVVVASSQSVYGEGQYQCNEHGFFLPKPRNRQQLERGRWEVECPQCGQASRPLRLREEYVNPFNQYAVSKHAGERLALGLGWLHGIPTVALRYSITQGPRQSLFNHYSGICRIFTSRLRRSLPPPIYEDGMQTRDFVHVDDVVEANILAMLKEEVLFQAFNVGSGTPITVFAYADRLCRAIGRGVTPALTGEYRVGDNRHSVSSIDALGNAGWKPRKNLDDIISDFLAWVDSLESIPEEAFLAEQIMRDAGVIRRVEAPVS